MIIFMSDIICVTNRKLCRTDFLSKIEEIAKTGVSGIILREKDLSGEEYKKLAQKVMKICKKYNTLCILHSFYEVAIQLESDAVHLPLPLLRKMTDEQKSNFRILGASCHSVEDALEAERLGCTYIIAGHIFATDCKKGVEPRGPEFLKDICESVSIPVYAIGGINASNIESVKNAGAKGGCIMSGFMR